MILRLLVGRGAARVLAGAARGGVRSAGMTFGRGVSIGGLTARQSLMTPAGSRVIGPNRREIATTEKSKTGKGTYTRVNGSDILYSENTLYGMEHNLGSNVAGRSYYRRNNSIEHRDYRGNVSGYDQLRLAQRVIKHFDRDEKEIGESQFIKAENHYEIQADDETINSFEALSKAYGLDCPETKNAYDEFTRYQEACLTGTGPCGAGTELRRRRWQEMLNSCRLDN